MCWGDQKIQVSLQNFMKDNLWLLPNLVELQIDASQKIVRVLGIPYHRKSFQFDWEMSGGDKELIIMA